MNKEELKQRFEHTRAITEELVAPLTAGDFESQPVEWVSPPKWHLGHTTWFFEQFLLKESWANYEWYNHDFAYLFNSYYNTVGDRVLRANRGNLTRPVVEEVLEYRKAITERVLNYIETNELTLKQYDIIELGINHEQQHQELLLTDLKYILGNNPLLPNYDGKARVASENSGNKEWIKIDEGNYIIGHNEEGFCYDNELSRHQVFLHEFEVSNQLITNGEFLEFMNSGGYSNFEYWLDEGWAWIQKNNISSPMYWHNQNDTWYNYTLAGYQKVKPDEILCHISFYEAAAFAEWKGMRLPTEFEWEVAADKLNWGARWEWTASSYLPYPGFDKPEGAVGEYNGKFMINQMVLRGASVATSPNHSRKTYRNFFHPHFQWQFSGIRLAKKQRL